MFIYKEQKENTKRREQVFSIAHEEAAINAWRNASGAPAECKHGDRNIRVRDRDYEPIDDGHILWNDRGCLCVLLFNELMRKPRKHSLYSHGSK